MAEEHPIPWLKYSRALAPAVLFWAALVTVLAYLLTGREGPGGWVWQRFGSSRGV